MRRKDKEIKDIKEIEDIIKKASICRLGLSLNDIPYIVPLNYGYKDNSLYFHSAKEGKKIDILKKNSKVCFEIDIDNEITEGEKPCNWGVKYRSVMGTGQAQIVDDCMEKKLALSLIMEHYNYSGLLEFKDRGVDSVAIIRVDIKEISGKKSGY